MSPRAPYRNKSVVLFMVVNESIRRGWSYEKMADAAAVERNTVRSWCRGDRSPNIANIERWAKELGGYIHFTLPPEVTKGTEDGVIQQNRSAVPALTRTRSDATAVRRR